jgi:fructose-1,6-bisphosphatase/sedoheptulose 1,7-bisphosphatase-like protein
VAVAGEAVGAGAGRSKDALQSAGGAIGAVLSEVATTILPGQDKARGKGKGKVKGAKERKRDKADKEGQRVHH